MRVIAVLSLAVAVAFATRLANSQWDESSLYKQHVQDAELHAKRVYHYQYEGQIATGIPQASEQHAAQRVQAHVALYMKDQKTAVMEMRQIRMGTLNKEVPEPREVLPFRAFEEQPIEPEYERVLRLPIRFVYEAGMVRDIEFDQKDQIWSMNMKRAVLNLLQVNLKKEGRTDLAEQKLIRDIAQNNEHTEQFFTAQEKTIEGDCEAMYTWIKKSSDESEKEQLEITKSVNFDKCAKRADLRYNLRFAEICPDCEKQLSPDAERVAQTTSVMTMNVTRPIGQSHRFIVKEAELRAHYSWAPMRPEDNIIAAYSVTRMHLVKVEEKPEKKPVEPKSEKKEHLLYNIEQDVNKERFYMENDDEYLRQLTTAEQMNKVAVVEKLVAQLVQDTEHVEQGIHAETPHHFARIVQMFRFMKAEEVSKIVRKFVIDASKELEAAGSQKARDFVVDALAQAGTKTAFEEMTQLIKKQKVHALKAAQSLKTMMNTPVVGEKHVTIVMDLCEELDSASANPAVRQSCWLTAGALAGQVCRPTQEKQALEVADEHHKRCTRDTKKRFMAVFERLYQKANSRYEKVLALKTIANSGIDIAVFPLEKIISSPSEPKAIRIAAIDALRLLRTQMPRKLQNILMPIFKNQYEHPEVRMNALNQLLETLPERAVLEQIAAQLRNERSHQVHSFVHTALSHYANSTIPCERRMADDLQVVLRAARVQPRRLMDSRMWHQTLYCNTYKMGVSSHMTAIFTNNSFIPKELTASFNSIFAGEWNKYVAQIGFYQENLDEVVAKLIEQLDENTISEVLRAQRNADIKPAELLKKLQRALNIERRSSGESRDAHATLYVRVKDLDYAVIPLDKQSLAELARRLFTSGRFDVQQLQKELARGFHGQMSVASFNYESIRKMPTAFGAPITITSKLPLVAHIKTGLKTELNAAKAAVKLSVQGELKLALTHITHLDVSTPLASVGTKVVLSVQMHTPLNAELEAVAGEKLSTKLTIRAPEQKKRVLSAETRPITYVRVWPLAARHYIESVERTIVAELIEQQTESVDFKFGERATGVRARLVAHWPRRLLNQPTGTPFALLAGHNSLQLTVEPTETTPKQWTFRMEADAIQAIERMERDDETPELDSFYEKRVSAMEQRDLMETEDYESSEVEAENEKQEQSRRSDFLRHARSMRQQKGLKNVIQFRYEAEQSPVERRARVTLTSACERRLRFCKWTLEAERTPMTKEEQQKWTMKAVAQILYPELALTMQQLKEQPHREFTARLSAEWGSQSERRQTVELRVQGEQNKEQQRWMRFVERSEKSSPLEQIERMTDAAQLNQYKLTATYNLARNSQRVLSHLYELAKARLYFSPSSQLRTLEPEQRRLQKRITTEGVEGEMVAVLTVSPRSRNLINLTVETPYERVQLIEVRLPYRISPLNIRREFATRLPLTMRQTLRSALSTPFSRDSCTVKATRVSTFDDVIYKAPLATCWQQIAADCSAGERFNVLIKRTQPKTAEMTLKIVTSSAELVFEQTPNKKVMKITANGEQLNVEKYEAIAKYGILRVSENYFEIANDDFTVAFDGYTARVQVARHLRSLQCGLCGNYDGEKEDEFRTAQNELTHDIQAFHKSYLYTKEECELDESMMREKKNYEKFESVELETSSSEEEDEHYEHYQQYERDDSTSKQSTSSSSSESKSNESGEKKNKPSKPFTRQSQSWRSQQLEKAWYSDEMSNEKSSSQESYENEEPEEYEQKKRDTIKPVTRTHVVEKSSEVCFSVKPVKTCPKETFEQKTEASQVDYVCVPRDHSAVRKLLTQARQSIVSEEKLVRIEGSHKVQLKLEQPRLCVVY